MRSASLVRPSEERPTAQGGQLACWQALGALLLCAIPFLALAQPNRPQVPTPGVVQLILLSSGDALPPLSASRRVLREQLALTPADDLRPLRTETDELGFSHVRYQQYFRGVKVEHGVMSIHARGGLIESLSGELPRPAATLRVRPRLSMAAARQQALAAVGAATYKWQLPAEEAHLRQQSGDPNATYFPPGELVIVEDFRQPVGSRPLVLAWRFNIYAQQPLSRELVYVEAQTGQVVLRDAVIAHLVATGSLATRYDGVRSAQTDAFAGGYRLRDYSRGKGIITLNMLQTSEFGNAVDFVDANNAWTAAEYDNAAKDNAALSVHFNTQATYDYWSAVHGRDSYDDKGAALTSYVHFNVNYSSAFWDGAEMVYGDGDGAYRPYTSLDICGHEIGHAVCEHTAALLHQGEPGSLNEGIADIWGACVEYSIDPAKQTWLTGEDIPLWKPALLSLSNPNDFGRPDTYMGDLWDTSPNPELHANGNVISHWFYLLSVGGTGTNDFGTSYDVTGITIQQAARLMYRAERLYMTPSSTYTDARRTTLQAAIDLFGLGSVEVTAVAQAWKAVGLDEGVPTLSALSPGSGPIGQTITLTGTNLGTAFRVTCNGVPATRATLTSATSLSVVVPAGATTGAVVVTTPTGVATSPGSFTVLGGTAPTISSFTPVAGQVAGGTVTISGTGFSGTTSVRFNGTAASSYTIVTATTITTTVPAGATSGTLTVTTPGGTAYAPTSCVVLPALTAFTPASGAVGAAITLAGTGLTTALDVRFNGVATPSLTVNSATSVTATVPPGASTGPVSVRTAAGTATSTANFTVTPSYTLTSFTPTGGAPGTTRVTIRGTGFTGATAVNFNNVAATFTVASATEIWATVPGSATTGLLTVTVPTGLIQSATSFMVQVPGAPAISSFSPTAGIETSVVTIQGTNFSGATSVKFNGTAAPAFTVASSTCLVVTVPAGATTGAITITTSLGTGQSAGSYTVYPPPANDRCTALNLPVLVCGDSLICTTLGATRTDDPAAGCNSYIGGGGVFYRFTGTGDSIQLRVCCGPTTGFYSKLHVFTGTGTNLACVAGTSTYNVESSLTFSSVSGVDYLIFVSGPPPNDFVVQGEFTLSVTCRSYLSLAGFTPGSGPVGTTVTLTGTGFTDVTGVFFSGNGTIYAALFSSASDHEITVSVPPGAITGPIILGAAQTSVTSTTPFAVLDPAPANDLCTATNLPMLTCGSSVTGTTLAATSGGDPTTGCAAQVDGAGVFYRFTGTGATVTVQTCGGTTNFDTRLHVFTGTCGNLTCVATNDDACATASAVTFSSVNGVGYWVFVSGFQGAQGNFTLAVSCQMPPSIGTLTPAAGQRIGASVTLTGTGFTGTTAVKFNGIAATSFTVSSATSITAVVPAGATSGPVTVTTPAGTSAPTAAYKILPYITAFSPSSGPVGTTVTITGTALTGATQVKVGSVSASSYAVYSSTQIKAVVGAGATSGPVSVTTPSGTRVTGLTFTVTPPTPPTISSFAPGIGPVGTVVHITGTGFIGVTSVKFNGTAASSVTVNSATTITATVAAGTTTGFVTVTTATSSVSTVRLAFFVTSPTQPAITSVSPTAGQWIGYGVTLTGVNFTDATTVEFNGTATTRFTVNSATSLTVPVPTGATTGPITVTTPAGPSAPTASYKILPYITSFTPSRGLAGTTVIITGTALTGATQVKIGSANAASYVVNSSTQVTAVVGPGSTSGPVTVTTPSGTRVTGLTFTIIAARGFGDSPAPATVVVAGPGECGPVAGAQLAVWPNPAHQLAQVQGAPASSALLLLDLTGRPVRRLTANEAGRATFDLSGLAPGMYVVRCAGLTRRLVVE